jgi:CheY-like chemotaxis protein
MDRGQLEQVIVNLAVNARDAMDSGGRLRIECEQVVLDPAEFTLGRENTPEKGWYARMSVSDTGCGMEPDTLARAFEPFFTTKGPAHGTGLGLASVYGIVRNSGGTVRIYSEPGRGTTVKVHLPLSDEQPMVAEPVASPAFQRDAMPARILVVEDSPELAEVVLRLLRPAGYTVTIAYSAVDALALLAAGEAVDLLVTDVVMPGMTGPELVKAVRPAHPTMPVLYTSGYTAGILGARAHLEPDATFIEKPFTRGALLSMVAKLLSRQ